MEEASGTALNFIAGGVGLAPLRGAIRESLEHPERFPSVRLLLGARTPAELLYAPEVERWTRIRGHFKASVTVDRANAQWTGHVGVVTTLIRRKYLQPYATYFICGPEIMMRFAIDTLLEAQVPAERVWLTMERNMT